MVDYSCGQVQYPPSNTAALPPAMTIEFRCPYCTAPIHVADQAAGTSGRCPRCAAKVAIPRPAGLPPAAVEPAPPAPVPSAPQPAPVADEPDAPFEFASPPVAAQAGFATPGAPVQPRGRRPQGVPLLLPILGVMILGGLIGWFAWRDWDRRQLKGELTGVELSDVELEPVIISRADIGVDSKDREEALKRLAANPVPMISELMQVQFRGDDKGLVISVARGNRSVWYRVDGNSNALLANYLQHELKPLEAARESDLAQAAAGFVDQYLKVSRQEAPESTIRGFRDRLGLTALVRGLGHHVTAVVGSNMYPCVYEQSNGSLYFLLPANLKQFELTGRRMPGGQTTFPGRFTVKVR
jgi:hypothetical protein